VADLTGFQLAVYTGRPDVFILNLFSIMAHLAGTYKNNELPRYMLGFGDCVAGVRKK